LASEPKSRPVISWRWAFAAFAALGLISIALLVVRTNAPEKPHLTRKTEPAATSTQVAKVEPQVSAPHGKSIHPQHVLAVSRRSATRQKEVTAKLATFPAPTPETDQERMLARLAAQRGSFELAREAPDPAIKDLQLKELAVEPLEGTPPDIAQ
jgi:hypothetical protein